MIANPKVSSLYIYPVKSCAGIEMKSVKITSRGPQYDREWMLIDASSKIFLSQRVLPLMAKIQTRLTTTHMILGIPEGAPETAPQTNGALREFQFSLAAPDAARPTLDVQVWNDTCAAYDEGDEVAKALTDFLGSPGVRLVRMAENFQRLVPEKYNQQPGSHVSFADAFSFMLMTTESLADLNSKLSTGNSPSVPMNRFRPNIVVSGGAPYEEDSWRNIKIGAIRFQSPKLCDRCIIINTDQASGQRSAEPLKTLSTYRRSEKNKVQLGQNLTHLNEGQLSVGDELAIVT
jgi:uncharacterized protein